MHQKIEISSRTIILILGIIFGLWLVIQIQDILFLLLISFILMSSLRQFVDKLEKRRIPRIISILIIYALVFGVFGFSLASIMPSLIWQFTGLIKDLPVLLDRIAPSLDLDVRALSQQIAPISENVVKITVNIFNNVFAIFSVMIFTFYFLLERNHLSSLTSAILGDELSNRVIDIITDIEHKLGSWLNAQFILMLTIGIMTYIGLSFLQIDFALPLAIIAGIMEIIPIMGPIISAVPAVLIALTISPFFALVVAGLYFLIQQIENNILVPVIMKKSTGLPPLVTILALLIGGRLTGLLGALLAVPVVLMLQTVSSHLLKKNRIS